jgi:hypothetical protein
VDDHLGACGPALEIGRKTPIGDEVDLVGVGLADLVEDPVDQRPPADTEELLRNRVGERP